MTADLDMNGLHLSLLLAYIIWVAESHIIPVEKQEKVSSRNIFRVPEIIPPISIIDLKKASRRVSRAEAEKNKWAKKKDVPEKKKTWTPPPNCVPLKSSCKPPAPPCCDPCAFCYCHFFKTVCIYKMGNPNC
ncbi:agouti-signaling protein-like [Bufo gargarizans]|uniref:agouti-signaling protein-like n=1 Tax=Bufo gargarizans TaxID=30331 RepID=UPI001CF3DA12|nr:agouti-signaling protein-like [Bufo gargarizans]